MKKSSQYLFAVALAGGVFVLSTQEAISSGQGGALVRLQSGTPGVVQSGHLNVNGTAKAGQFVGDGTGLSNVNANLLDGINSTSFLQSIPVPLQVAGNVPGSSVLFAANISNVGDSTAIRAEANGSGATYGGYFLSEGSTGIGVVAISTATTGNTRAGYFQANSDGAASYGILATSQGTYGVGGQSTRDTGSAYGGHFVAQSTLGIGVLGRASAATGTTTGGYFEAYSTSGRGVLGNATANTGTTYGGLFTVSSTAGRAVFGSASAASGSTYGGYFQTASTSGTAISGMATATSGSSFGGYFSSNSPNGTGVSIDSAGIFGIASEATKPTGTTYGGYFLAASTTGRAVYGAATATGATDTPYGIRGQASTASSGYAVYAVGDLGASGVKPFRIDHPLDPANKYLLHYSAESPFPQNFYNGTVTTDGKGRAWVELPDYFASVNTNFKYHLTVVDDTESETFVQVKIGKKIANNRFLIMSNIPNVEVSWEVKADRNDERIKINRPTDVKDKQGTEKGKYQHPEYYNLPAEMGMDPLPERAPKPKVN